MSPDARLDLETGGERYEVIVYAVDSGTPVKETATTTVTVNIIDVNNKPPTFNESTYLIYVSERAAIGTPFFQQRIVMNTLILYKSALTNDQKLYIQ